MHSTVTVMDRKTRLQQSTSQKLPSHSKLPKCPSKLNCVMPRVLAMRGRAELSTSITLQLMITWGRDSGVQGSVHRTHPHTPPTFVMGVSCGVGSSCVRIGAL